MKTGMKLIQGALFVLLFLFAACTPYRRPIPDEMIGEHRIHRADGLMTQDYRLSIIGIRCISSQSASRVVPKLIG